MALKAVYKDASSLEKELIKLRDTFERQAHLIDDDPSSIFYNQYVGKAKGVDSVLRLLFDENHGFDSAAL